MQLVIFDAARNYTLCAETTVSLRAIEPGPNARRVAGYEAAIFNTPACMSPANIFQFYVNGIYVASASFASTAMAPLASYI